MLRVLLGWLGIDGPAELVDLLHLLLRKFAHFSIYALLGSGVMGTALTFEGKGWKKFLLALSICAGYAATDEFYQLFTGTRPAGCAAGQLWRRLRLWYGNGGAMAVDADRWQAQSMRE